jgi:hypothetical protein
MHMGSRTTVTEEAVLVDNATALGNAHEQKQL